MTESLVENEVNLVPSQEENFLQKMSVPFVAKKGIGRKIVQS